MRGGVAWLRFGVVSLPDRNDYYLALAFAAARRANCSGRRVGAVLVKEDRVIATGYNGTPEGITNCLDGGCRRCADRDQFEAGTHYDLCICVHAEANALVQAMTGDAVGTLESLAAHRALRGIRPMIQDLPDPDWMLGDELKAIWPLGR